ncbi:ATP-binding protein [Desulfococcaceae bacterium HSG8]|nr:ATP-binding protein [Desulfococcaceae bacterium HSG8]
MLRRISVTNCKSLRNVKVKFPRLAVLFGPNAAGKSNFIDALQILSRLVSCRTLSEALSGPVRGYPLESFAFPGGGLASLLNSESSAFSIEAETDTGKERYLYRVTVRIQPGSGILSVGDEYLAVVTENGEVKGSPLIEKKGDQLCIRRGSKPALTEPVGLDHTILSDSHFSGAKYRHIELCRSEISGWRTYYLDPRIAMRQPGPPSDIRDIGVSGRGIAPFLFRLKAENPGHFAALLRTLRSLIPGVECLDVELDKKRGLLDISIRQDGTDFSSRIISDGTLRVLGLCAVAVNPLSDSLIGFEEPENGVHPGRLELIADLLSSLAISQKRQVIVTTHSPLLCDAVLRKHRSDPGNVALLRVGQERDGTRIVPIDTTSPLFQDNEIRQAMTSGSEEGIFGELLMRGLIDG